MASDVGFLAIWALLEAAFGAQERARYNLYRQRFANNEDEAVKHAAMKCIDECRSFPTVADILARLPGTVSPVMSAEAAWTRVLHAASNDAPWSRTDSAHNIPSMPTGQGLDQATLDAIGGPRGLHRLAVIIEQQPGRLSYERRDFLTRFGQLGNLNAAGYLPDGQKQVEVDLIEDGYSNDHLLTDGYDAEGYDA